MKSLMIVNEATCQNRSREPSSLALPLGKASMLCITGMFIEIVSLVNDGHINIRQLLQTCSCPTTSITTQTARSIDGCDTINYLFRCPSDGPMSRETLSGVTTRH